MEKPHANTFPREVRIVRAREYDRVFSARKSVADGTLVVYARPNDLAFARAGIIAGKKVGNAVVRNRVKRLLRETFRTSRSEIPSGFDYVIVTGKNSSRADFENMKSSFINLAKQAGAKWQQ